MEGPFVFSLKPNTNARTKKPMKSYISEIENPIVQRDIIELGRKIEAYRNGAIDEEKFRALRLARGVYGQRQPGVQMVRIKFPFGRVTPEKLERTAAVCDTYSTGNLHITTRQDIQIHFVKLDDTPALWAELEKDEITLREACGNTVRNVTASALAGIDPQEVFDVSPWADLVFRYFLRKPFGQEMGRKVKIAFSGNESDDAFTFMHDFGFIARSRQIDGREVQCFKVLVGGGLGAQPFLAATAYEFLPAHEIIPFLEAALRVFDRHGERNSRHKARIKYLINALGIDAFMELVAAERTAVQYNPDTDHVLHPFAPNYPEVAQSPTLTQLIADATDEGYRTWLRTNVLAQKQPGYFAAFLKVRLGNFSTEQARLLAAIVRQWADADMRFTIDQSILLRGITAQNLHRLYEAVRDIGLGDSGYHSVADVTSCPGTDTCNLGISNSTHVARVIEDMVRDEFPEMLYNRDIKIKISGCMNSCGQHGLAHIGFHGSSMKVGTATVPALQVLMGGGVLGSGHGRMAEKIIKVPSKRVLDVVRLTLQDFEAGRQEDENLHSYFDRVGKNHFYNLLKPLADTETLAPHDLIDWGQEEAFKTAIGVGECAGVMIDLVATLLFDAREKLAWAREACEAGYPGDAVYHAYAAAISTAKALLLRKDVRCNTHYGIINDFDTHLYAENAIPGYERFRDFVLQINQHKPEPAFAKRYLSEVHSFIENLQKQAA
jgi:sulfite reductase (ferredoxin)